VPQTLRGPQKTHHRFDRKRILGYIQLVNCLIKKENKMNYELKQLAALLVIALGLTSFGSDDAAAAAIGPGPTAPLNGLDNAGGTRTNVDLTNTVFLQPGTYNISNFSFEAGQNGSVQPFVAIQTPGQTANGTSSDGFTVIAAGANNAVVASSPTSVSVPFGPNSTFTIPAGGAQVYLGITNSAASNPVYIVNAGTDDHQSPAFASPFSVGSEIGPPGTGNFSNPGLNRTYAYSMEIQSAHGPQVINGSFESPSLGAGNFREGNPAIGWTQIPGPQGSSGGGIVGNGSAYGNPNAPDGVQAGLLKDEGGMSQMVGGFAHNQPYTLSFDAAGRSGGLGPNPFTVTVGSQTLTFSGNSTVTPGTSYALYTSAPFYATSGSELLSFVSALRTDQDLSSYVDNIKFAAVTPEPSSFVLCGLGAVGMIVAVRRRRKG
jgi:hypothetical protein